MRKLINERQTKEKTLPKTRKKRATPQSAKTRKHSTESEKSDESGDDNDTNENGDEIDTNKELITALDTETNEALEREREITAQLANKLNELESQLVRGGKNILDTYTERQMELEKKLSEIAERKVIEIFIILYTLRSRLITSNTHSFLKTIVSSFNRRLK